MVSATSNTTVEDGFIEALCASLNLSPQGIIVGTDKKFPHSHWRNQEKYLSCRIKLACKPYAKQVGKAVRSYFAKRGFEYNGQGYSGSAISPEGRGFYLVTIIYCKRKRELRITIL